MPAVANPEAPLARPDYRLQDNLWAEAGSVFLTGTQALVRLPLMQSARDAQAGLNTRGFVSGYRGSPLGMVDQTIWKAGPRFSEAGIRFVPAINEELAATQVLGAVLISPSATNERLAILGDGVFQLHIGAGVTFERIGAPVIMVGSASPRPMPAGSRANCTAACGATSATRSAWPSSMRCCARG